MFRRTSATPCPVPTSTDLTSRRDSIFDVTTTNIDFTAEFTRGNQLTGTKPRRRQTCVRKEVVIHEDELPQDAHQKPAGNSNLGGSLLARPAKRLRGRASFAGDIENARAGLSKPVRLPLATFAEMEPQEFIGSINAQPAEPPRRRISTVGSSILKANRDDQTVNFPSDQVLQGERALTKPPRRGTIYIPPDDTTIPSMYMGIFSPVKELTSVVDDLDKEVQVKVKGIAAEMIKRRGRRSSLAAEPARRVGPMRPVLGVVREQDSSFKINTSQEVDRVRPATGKENLPPGFQPRDLGLDSRCSQHLRTSSRDLAKPVRIIQEPRTVFGTSTSVSTKLQTEKRKPAWNSGATMKVSKVEMIALKQTIEVQEPRKEQNPSPKVPSRFVLPKVQQEEHPSQHFPPLNEDIGNAAMYEDSWLSHQEVAITQLLNSLFSAASSRELVDVDTLRFELLELYQSSPFVLLHKRVHGAILYGALRVPENVLSNASRLQNDLGMRRTFIDLWTRTYDRDALKTALEVIVGRQCQISLKDIRTFIDVFLIRNEDGISDSDEKDPLAWSYRRTILRSLIIVKLLDHLKTMPNNILMAPLFLTTSTHKTSMSVLHAMIQLLNPSMGQRALSHLDYVVEHKQHPLEEYEYPVANLAVDLRDGVRLTRLVELLLYPSASSQLARESPEDAMMTLSMPTGEILSMLDIDTPTKSARYPLSQHLKFPCEGRVVKLFNVQVALTALQQVKSLRSIVEGISADDVVDGFREKTVAMLWGLTGKWGLGGLIDWKDVRSEIARFQRRKGAEDSDILDEDELEDLSHSFTGYKTLLKAWAGAVACSKGLRVKNLTTSFADGRVFEAIVDEYEAYLPSKSSSPMSRKSPLHERLSRLGCSSQFSSLFAPCISGNKYQIFDRDFTLAALAFLCSRLLSASKRARSSIVIQRAWRSYHLRVEARRQRMASMLARQCAEVVNTRERLLASKMTILGAWRLYKAKGRKRVLDDDHEDTNLEAGDLWLNL